MPPRGNFDDVIRRSMRHAQPVYSTPVPGGAWNDNPDELYKPPSASSIPEVNTDEADRIVKDQLIDEWIDKLINSNKTNNKQPMTPQEISDLKRRYLGGQ